MIPAPAILVIDVAAFSICGGPTCKQFAITRQPLWMVASVTAYYIPNFGSLLRIDETGLARAPGASVQILGFSAVADFTGERIAVTGRFLAVLVCLSFFLSSIQSEPGLPSRTFSKTQAAASSDASHNDFPMQTRGGSGETNTQ
ncbi:MAG: hypothetical protein AAFQ58_23495 [Pseudomonadota bacterium]